ASRRVPTRHRGAQLETTISRRSARIAVSKPFLNPSSSWPLAPWTARPGILGLGPRSLSPIDDGGRDGVSARSPYSSMIRPGPGHPPPPAPDDRDLTSLF